MLYFRYEGAESFPYDEQTAIEWWMKGADHDDSMSCRFLKQFVDNKRINLKARYDK